MGCEQYQGSGTWFVCKILGGCLVGKTKVIPEAVIHKVQAFPIPTTVAVLTRMFGIFWLLESIYPALSTNSEALILVDMKEHQVGLG